MSAEVSVIRRPNGRYEVRVTLPDGRCEVRYAYSHQQARWWLVRLRAAEAGGRASETR